MITQISFKDFKLLQNVQIELGRLNVIVGRNGVGKSTVLEGLEILMALTTEQEGEANFTLSRPGRVFDGRWAPRHLLSKPFGQELVLASQFNTRHAFGISIPTHEGPEFEQPFRWWVKEGTNTTELRLPTNMSATNPKAWIQELPKTFGRVLRLELDPGRIARPHANRSLDFPVDSKGDGLASALNLLIGLRDDAVDRLESDLAQIVPGVKGLRVLPERVEFEEREQDILPGTPGSTGLAVRTSTKSRTLIGSRFELEFEYEGWVRAEYLSEGTLLAVGLLTFMHYNPPTLLLIDDIDKGLHPTAQRDLVRVLKGILKVNRKLQIVATSHSPFVLDELEAHEIFIAGSTRDKGTVVKRLDKHEGWESRSRFMRPGEFWSAVGEEWVGDKP